VEKYRMVAEEHELEGQELTHENRKRAERAVKKRIAEWVNLKTDCPNGFSAIHFACFKGDPAVIRMLHRYGACLFVKNEMGLSPMHVAAQADKAFSLSFLY